MAFIDASGFCSVDGSCLAHGTIAILASGFSSSEAAPIGAGKMLQAGSGLCSIPATPLGHLVEYVELVSVEAKTSLEVRITFDKPMLNNGALRSTSSYGITPKFPSGAPLVLTHVQPEGVVAPTYVDVTVTEMTDGETYIAEVATPIGPVDTEGTPINPAANTVEYFGIGIDPTILSVTATGLNTVEVKFSEPMDDNAGIRNPSRYSFDNGLSVLSISSVVGDTVTLVTDDQTPGVLYTLTITQP